VQRGRWCRARDGGVRRPRRRQDRDGGLRVPLGRLAAPAGRRGESVQDVGDEQHHDGAPGAAVRDAAGAVLAGPLAGVERRAHVDGDGGRRAARAPRAHRHRGPGRPRPGAHSRQRALAGRSGAGGCGNGQRGVERGSPADREHELAAAECDASDPGDEQLRLGESLDLAALREGPASGHAPGPAAAGRARSSGRRRGRRWRGGGISSAG